MFQIVKKKIKYENIQKDKTEFEKTLKNKSKTPEEKRQAIVEIFTTYRNDFDAIETLLGIINKNTSKEDSEKAKQEAWDVFNAYLNNNYRADNVIKALQSTVDTLYKKDNYYSGLLQDCLVGNEIEHTQECHDFDDKYIGLVYGLGVCRNMAKLVKYLITKLNKPNIQACSVNDCYHRHAWNYLRFKNGDNNYTYHRVDTYGVHKTQEFNQDSMINDTRNKCGYKLDNELLDTLFIVSP